MGHILAPTFRERSIKPVKVSSAGWEAVHYYLWGGKQATLEPVQAVDG